MKILLTGAKGNLGSELILQSPHDFVGLNRDGWGDLDAKLAGGVDVVVHAASDLLTSASESPAKLMDSNLQSTVRLLEGMRARNIGRIVFISSCAVYGDVLHSSEASRCAPLSINGICKLLNERIISEFCAGNGIKHEILRVFNTYGGADHFSILSHMKRSIEGGKPFTINNMGCAQRDFIHVSDVAAIVLRLLDMDVPFEIMNVGTGKATKVSTLVDLVRERYSDFPVHYSQVSEVEYSRADISRLLGLMAYDFIRIEDYIRESFECGRA